MKIDIKKNNKIKNSFLGVLCASVADYLYEMNGSYPVSALLFCLMLIFASSLYAAPGVDVSNKDSLIKSNQEEGLKEFKKDDAVINKDSDILPSRLLLIKREGIRTGSESIHRKITIINTPGSNASIQGKAEVKSSVWEYDEAFFCTVYGTVAIDFPIDYFSKLYSSSVGAEVTVIGEKWSKWGIHPTLYYRMFRLQSLGKPIQVASVYEGHGFGIGVEYSYGINLSAINRKLYLHAGFFNGLMVMALFSDNYQLPFYDATYMLGVSAGVSIRVWEYLMARVSFEYMPIFTAGTATQFVAVTISIGVRI